MPFFVDICSFAYAPLFNSSLAINFERCDAVLMTMATHSSGGSAIASIQTLPVMTSRLNDQQLCTKARKRARVPRNGA